MLVSQKNVIPSIINPNELVVCTENIIWEYFEQQNMSQPTVHYQEAASKDKCGPLLFHQQTSQGPEWKSFQDDCWRAASGLPCGQTDQEIIGDSRMNILFSNSRHSNTSLNKML